MKKKEKENKKNDDQDDDEVKMPNIHNITLTKKDITEIEDNKKKKRKCC